MGDKYTAKHKALDDILDAALDELDSDDDNDVHDVPVPNSSSRSALQISSSESNVESPVSSTQPPKASHQEQQAYGENPDIVSMEEMMKSLMAFGEQLNKNEGGGLVDPEQALASAIREMEAQLHLHSSNTSSANGTAKVNGKADRTSSKGADQTTAGQHTTTDKETSAKNKNKNKTNIDTTVNKLLHEMSKAGTNDNEGGYDPSQFEAMGEDLMNEIMKDFQAMGKKGDADDVVDGMMRQLLSKDLMYEPMKQVTDKFPSWLAEKKKYLSEEEYNRYGHQYQYFQRIVAVYETDPDNFPRLIELMQDIQE